MEKGYKINKKEKVAVLAPYIYGNYLIVFNPFRSPLHYDGNFISRRVCRFDLGRYKYLVDLVFSIFEVPGW